MPLPSAISRSLQLCLSDKPWNSVAKAGNCSLFLILLVVLTGCGGSSSPPSPPLTPMSATIDPSLNGMKTGVLPILVKIQLAGGASANNVTITLGGVDVSANFAEDSDGELEAQLSSTEVYIGPNRLVASIVGASGSATTAPPSKSTFTYDPTLVPGTQPISFPAPLPDVIPILTRVLYNNSTFGVQVGNSAYPSSGAVSSGFQVIQLNRSTLNLVSNQTYSIQSDSDVFNFVSFISPSANNIASCGYGGCLTIIQSLNDPGYNPCLSSGDSCSAYTSAFASIGGTSTIGYVPPSSDIGYSFIGNIGQDILHAGGQDERITCSSLNCGSFPVPDDVTVSQGISPNGQQSDVMPNLNQTGSTDCPITTATQAMPQVTYCLNGSISGALVLAGTQAYTFAIADPPVRYNMTVAPENPNKSFLTLGATGVFAGLALESAELPANGDGSPVGGFHLVVVDATTLQDYANTTYTLNNKSCPPVSNGNYCIGPDGTNIYELDQLYKDIRSSNSRKYLFFLHSIGSLNHNGVYGSNANTSYWAQDIWDRDAQAVLDLGGTWVTFDSLNNYAFTQDPYDQYSNQTVPTDDYNMIGQWWINASGVSNPYAAEESSQISRQTINTPTPPVSNMYGVLSKERDGYYRASSHSLSPYLNGQQSLDFASAALLPPTPWPISPSSTGGPLAAYTWISNQLLGCITSCGDIHNAYANLNISPNSWQGLLAQLKPTTDGGDNFSPSDFETVRGQLSLEFQYLSALRTYQANLQNLLQSEQANLSIILQQTVDDISGTIPVTTRNPSSSFGIDDWRSDVTNGLNIVGALSALVPIEGAQTGTSIIVSLTNFAIDASAKHTVDAKGRTLEELTHTLYAASEIAQQKIQQYSQILATNGNDFTRISNDWGRLQKVGMPLISNQIVWSGNASATLLNAFDTATARGLYKSIMPAAFQINQYRWASPGLHNSAGLQPQMYNDSGGECKYYEFLDYMIQNESDPTSLDTYYSFALWPGAPIDGLGVSIQNAQNTETFNTWWDVWTINWQYAGNSIDCPSGIKQPMRSFFTSSGILDPLDPTDPSRLGMYKPWLFQRSGFPVYQQNDAQFASNFWSGDGEENPPIQWNGGPLAPDPVNY